MNNKYKVALFSGCFGRKDYGGPVTRHFNIARVLKDNGIHFRIFGFNPKQVHPDYQLEEAIGGFPSDDELKQFNVFLCEQDFQCIYKLNDKGILPILGCNLVPNSASMHCLPYLDEDGTKRQKQSVINEKRWMDSLKGKIWCSQSYFQEKEYRRLGLDIHTPVYRIHNPVDTVKFHPDGQNLSDKFTVAWVGKENWAKAPWILEEIAHLMPHVRFKYLSNSFSTIDFPSNVEKILHNENQSMPKLLSDCHLYISTSVTENEPLAWLEAMACGLPTIAFRTSGWPEILKDGYNGVLVDLANTDHFVYEIEKMRLDDLRRINYGLNAREFIENHYSFDACYKQLINIFDKYLGVNK
jgi:glycosyltransferase involved in cell wall biosynthesis